MDMQGNRQLGVTQQQAWEALNDPATLRQCLAGCDKFEPNGEHGYAVAMAVKIGPVSAKFNGQVTLSDIQPPASYRLAFEGQGGVAGFGKGASSVSLTPNDAGCELAYTVQAQVGGKIAQLGQRLIDGAAKSMADDFFKRFEALMAERYPAAVVSVPEGAQATPAAPSADGAIKNIAATARPTGVTGLFGLNFPIWVWLVLAVLVAVAIAVWR